MKNEYDVLIIGAGLSGIGMGCHLQRECPDLSYAVIERRQAIGGTWDLFRYPGIRSDSDMLSFSYSFRPWTDLKVLADGPWIRSYVQDTARQFGVDKKVQYGLKVRHAAWSSVTQRWTVTVAAEGTGETRELSCRFLIGATGYYDYDQGYQPSFPGEEDFKGLRIHPQFWPEKLDYSGKRVVIIGSGATAVTLVPAMADTAAHVTMLQRSPSYIFAVPNYDKLTAVINKLLPKQWGFGLARQRNIFIQRMLYKVARKRPKMVRDWLLGNVKKALGPDADMTHFTPSYMPWDERLCAVPDGDLFKAIRGGKASVVTDQIKRFTATGIELASGKTLDADIIVTATGLKVQALGGISASVDGQAPPMSSLLTYKGVLIQNAPNLGYVFGYTNAPWTLKADIASRYLCRLLNHMKAKGIGVATPRAPEGEAIDSTIFGDLNSGYIRRAADVLPKQGRSLPWRVLHSYERDRPMLLDEPIEDAALEMVPAVAAAAPQPTSLAA